MMSAIEFFRDLNFQLPESFVHLPVQPFESNQPIIWGPFTAILLHANSDHLERVSEWLRRSDELVEFIRKVNDGPGFEIEWWTHRHHIFEVTERPVIENGILKLQNRPEKSQLWIRNLNVRAVGVLRHIEPSIEPLSNPT